VYGDDCVSRTQVFEWFVPFQEGRDLLEDDPHPGRPVSTWPNENVEKSRAIVMQGRRIT
jgi:hypothetical protein